MSGMLVLTRKPGEEIHVGDVVITFLSVRGTSGRIGIQAPPNVRIVRGEHLKSKAGYEGDLRPCVAEIEQPETANTI